MRGCIRDISGPSPVIHISNGELVLISLKRRAVALATGALVSSGVLMGATSTPASAAGCGLDYYSGSVITYSNCGTTWGKMVTVTLEVSSNGGIPHYESAQACVPAQRMDQYITNTYNRGSDYRRFVTYSVYDMTTHC